MRWRSGAAQCFDHTGSGDYNTLSTDNGPLHTVPATPLIFMGVNVDSEAKAMPNASANGGDLKEALPDDANQGSTR